MKTYKGFDKDLKCRDFQYEIGKEYETDEAKCCEKGFHACEYPLDVFNFYNPAESRFCEVEQSGKIDKSDEDTKVTSTKIKIGAEIGFKALVDASVKFILEKTKNSKASTNTGIYSASTNTGDRSASTNTGNCSASTNTGNYSASTNTGNCSASTNTGDYSASTNTGDYSASTNTGDYSASTNTGNYSASTNTGDYSASTNTGDYSASTNTGNCSASTNTGNCSASTNTGDRSKSSVSGNESVAIAIGYNSKAKASKGSAIVVCERGEWNGEGYPLIDIKSAIVDGESLKANTWYMLKNSEFIEVGEDE